MLKLSQFEYHLPPERIAAEPVSPRDHSRLLVLDKIFGQIQHARFFNLVDFLQPGDVLVRNNTKVIPARLYGQKESGGQVEILLNKPLTITGAGEIWEALTKPGLKKGQKVDFGGAAKLTAECLDDSGYTRKILLNKTGSQLFSALEKIGHTPLPPYINPDQATSQKLKEKYQTLFAKYPGSAAAPTAGLHFTPAVESALLKKGVEIIELTLHVGLGTFLPVKTENITAHQLHSEWFELPEATAQKLNTAKVAGRRMIAVGTTSTRVLETCSDDSGILSPKIGETDIYIYPEYRYKFVDGLITNFHLPQSTLLMLVAAFVSAPNTPHKFEDFQTSTVGQAYAQAIENEYRFYSFGDAMLII